MAEKHGMIRWFLSELPRLQEDGIISHETADTLSGYYSGRLAADSPRNYFLLALSIIGGLFITGGVILLIGHNWDMLGKKLQIAISFLPLLAAGIVSVYTLSRKKSQAWRECSALFTSGGGAVAVALLSHIYQMDGEFREFMFLIILFSLPLLYIFNSVSLTVVTSFMMYSQFCWHETEIFQLMTLGLFAALLPMVLYHVIRRDSPYRTVMNYVLIVCALFTLIGGWMKHGSASYVLLLASLFFLCGIRRYEQRDGFWQNPWLPFSFVLMTGVLTFLTLENIHADFPEMRLPSVILQVSVFAVFTGLFIQDAVKHRLTAARILLAGTVLMAVAAGFYESGILYMILSNLLLLAFSIVFLREGWRLRRMLEFNGGFLMLAVLLTCRFFDSGIGMLIRAGLFIVLGICFILSNVLLSRRIGKEIYHA